MVKNPPTNAGDIGLIPGLGRFHMPQSIEPQLQSLRATTTKVHTPKTCAVTREASAMRSPLGKLQKSLRSSEDPTQP